MRLTKDQVESYESNGFLFFPEYFDREELELLRDEAANVCAEDTPRRILERSGAVRTVFASHQTNEVFRCFSRLERLVRPAMQLLGSPAYIHQFKVNAKLALVGEQWEWHQDFLYWHKEDGMQTPRVLTAALFLQEVNDFNGPLLLVPGSQRVGMVNVDARRTHPECGPGCDCEREPSWASTLTADLKYKIDKKILAGLLTESGIHAVKGPAGSVLFFHGNIFHASANNLSPHDRLSVFVTYNSIENALPHISDPRPTYIASRDFSPVEPVPDESLLALRRVHA